MDPFQEHAITLYNQFITPSHDIKGDECEKKWSLLACEMALKENSLDSSIHLRVLNFLLELVKTSELTDNDWIFVIDCTRKGVKRLGREGGGEEVIGELLKVISGNICSILAVDVLLKLFLTCQDYGIKLNDVIIEYLNALYPVDTLKLDFDEFHFIDCPKSDHYTKQRCQRLLLLLDPLKGMRVDIAEDYWFELFSVSDSELISFMRRLLKADAKRFHKFYNLVIVNDLLSVDFFIDQLLTDSVELLELLVEISSLTLTNAGKHFKNFHTLLLLKLEMSSEAFPFNCKVLSKKLKIFINSL